jgi:hypothetical protein
MQSRAARLVAPDIEAASADVQNSEVGQGARADVLYAQALDRRMTESCGTCTLCCKLFAIEGEPLINKPINTWCRFCDPKAGCKIYDGRPKLCREYECLWLQSQARKPMPAELRPNRCKIIFDVNADGTLLVARVDPAYRGAEKAAPVVEFMDRLLRQGVMTYIICGETRQIYGHPGNNELVKIVEASIALAKE